MGDVLGILQQPWSVYFGRRADSQLQALGISAERIEALVAERADARREKNWQRADAIRDELEKAGILLEDKAGGTQWKVST
jgi:cysteinyl-tRNA synthetase